MARPWQEIDSSHRLMAAMVVALGILNFCCGEIVPAGGGLGWDGVRYAAMTRQLPSLIGDGQLSSYYAQRVLPSAVVRGMLLLVGAPFDNANIIRGFQIYNLVVLGAALFVWKRLADRFAISLAGRWLGFCGLFVNFMGSKHTFYYPVLTDVTALCLSLLTLLCYVEKRSLALLVTTVAGALTWSILPSVCGALLLVFLRAKLPPEAVEPPAPTNSIDSVRRSRLIRAGWILLLGLSIAGAFWLTRAQEGDAAAKLVTGLPALAGLTVAVASLAGSALFFHSVVGQLRTTTVFLAVLAIAALLVPWAIGQSMANPSVQNPVNVMRVIYAFILPPNGKVLLPLVGLSVYWGPLVLLGLLHWNSFSREARQLGPGFIAVIGLNLLLGLSGEPRAVTFGWPFFVLGIVLVMETIPRSGSFKYVFAALTILYAQFWMKINLAPWPEENDVFEFPRQVYFMHFGLWMTWLSYSLQLCAAVLGTLWLRSTMRPVGPRVLRA